jgi:hypothetical protein
MRLPSGKSIAIFFYDAPISQAVAFEKLLDSGERFADRLLSAFCGDRTGDQLVNMGTDGESYGHHHRWGEMALAYALRFIESNDRAKLTIYGEYLEKHPPEFEVQIHEGSAWSCSHGVGRWKENCGCNTGGHGNWNQEWRAPLRNALDWLRDEMAPLFEKEAKKLLIDPWTARNDYIQVILNREDENVEKFLSEHATHPLSENEKVQVLKLMELQRHAMLMFTSCGWFFDEISGLETVQVIQYAARAIQLAEDVFGRNLEEGFLKLLEKAKSNIPENGDGRKIYNKFVKPAMISWDNVVAHYAISSVFTAYEERSHVFLYSFEVERRDLVQAGKARLAVGTVKAIFEITRETKTYTYSVLYMGEHQLTAAVRPVQSEERYDAMTAELREPFDRGDFAETIRRMDRNFGRTSFSLRSLFKDEQRRILDEIFTSTREDLENTNRGISERYTPLIRFLTDLGTPLPPALKSASDFVIHIDILKQFKGESIDFDRLSALLEEARTRNIQVFDAELSLAMSRKLENLLEKIEEHPGDAELAALAARVAGVVRALPIDPNLWRVRNKYWKMLHTVLPEYRDKAAKEEGGAAEWVKHFLALGDELNFSKKHLQMV